MADRLQWVLDLQDRLSGPAAKIERELGRIKAQLKALDIAAKTNALDKITDPIKRQKAELTLHRDKLLLSKLALDKTGGASRKAGSDAGYFTRQLHDVLHIAQIVGSALGTVGRAAEAMGRKVLDAVSFRESSLIGFQSLFGDKGGVQTFERMTELAAKLGKPLKEVTGLARSLANVGVIGSDLEPMITLIHDLDALSPGAGEKLSGSILGAFSEGKFTSANVDALRGTRLKPDDILKVFGKGNRLAGKAILDTPMGIDPIEGTRALLQGVLNLEGGKLGSASGRRAESPDALMQRIESNLDRMFEKFSGSKGVGAFKKVLANLGDIFDPSSKSGKAMFARLDQLADIIARALDPLTGTEGKARMEAFFGSLTTLLGNLIPLLEKAAGFTEILIRYGAGERSAGAPKSVGEELSQLGGYFDPKNNRLTAALFGRSNSQFQSPYQQFSTPVININVDARGATKDDADHIARKAVQEAKKAFADEVNRAATQIGGQAQ